MSLDLKTQHTKDVNSPQIYGHNAILTKIPAKIFFCRCKKTHAKIYMERHRPYKSLNNLENKNKTRGNQST